MLYAFLDMFFSSEMKINIHSDRGGSVASKGGERGIQTHTLCIFGLCLLRARYWSAFVRCFLDLGTGKREGLVGWLIYMQVLQQSGLCLTPFTFLILEMEMVVRGVWPIRYVEIENKLVYGDLLAEGFRQSF